LPAFGGLTMSARCPLPSGVLGIGLEVDQLVGVDWRQVIEDRPSPGRVGVDTVDAVDPEHAPVLLGLARSADGTGDPVADAQSETADLAGADIHVVGAGEEAVAAHEPEPFVDDVEDAGRIGVAGALGLALQDLVDEVVLAVDGRVELEVAADLAELGDAHLTEVIDIEVIALARSLELLLLFEFADGSAEGGLAAPPWTAVAGTLVGAWAGHLSGSPGCVRDGLSGPIWPGSGSLGAERVCARNRCRSAVPVGMCGA
jgi:hypothetical protein